MKAMTACWTAPGLQAAVVVGEARDQLPRQEARQVRRAGGLARGRQGEEDQGDHHPREQAPDQQGDARDRRLPLLHEGGFVILHPADDGADLVHHMAAVAGPDEALAPVEIAVAAQIDRGAEFIELGADQQDQRIELGPLAGIIPQEFVQPGDLRFTLARPSRNGVRNTSSPVEQVAALSGLGILDRRQHTAEHPIHHHGMPDGLRAALLIGERPPHRDPEHGEDHDAAHDHPVHRAGARRQAVDDGGGRRGCSCGVGRS